MLTEDPGVPAGDALQEERARGPKATPWLLRRVSQRYGAVVAAHLEDAGLAGLPRPGYWLLMALASGSKDASQLVGAVGVTKQAISKVVDTLVLEGFVERRPNADDRRRDSPNISAWAVGGVASMCRYSGRGREHRA